MKMAETMTFSADGTGHQNINYNSQHAHMLVVTYHVPRPSDYLSYLPLASMFVPFPVLCPWDNVHHCPHCLTIVPHCPIVLVQWSIILTIPLSPSTLSSSTLS